MGGLFHVGFGDFAEGFVVVPQEHSNYYREYTVPTPGRTGRGERRLVTGGGTPQDPDVYYYTWDHYESFCEIPESDVE